MVEINEELEFGDGEAIATHAERKMVLGAIREAIQFQRQKFGLKAGAECKKWFLDEVKELAVNKWGSARELEEGMETLVADSDKLDYSTML